MYTVIGPTGALSARLRRCTTTDMRFLSLENGATCSTLKPRASNPGCVSSCKSTTSRSRFVTRYPNLAAARTNAVSSGDVPRYCNIRCWSSPAWRVAGAADDGRTIDLRRLQNTLSHHVAETLSSASGAGAAPLLRCFEAFLGVTAWQVVSASMKCFAVSDHPAQGDPGLPPLSRSSSLEASHRASRTMDARAGCGGRTPCPDVFSLSADALPGVTGKGSPSTRVNVRVPMVTPFSSILFVVKVPVLSVKTWLTCPNSSWMVLECG
mmetsp:Transcript_59336/g.158895  ORF Transcript_59336/g.158895 Transcript_59336/m.158895 type:complete len:266 (-) Transcript_59336:521-1318(-)